MTFIYLNYNIINYPIYHRAQGNFIKEKLQNALLVVRRYWQRPPKGQEVAYKEIAAFSVGSMGIKGYSNLMTKYIQMTATCLLTGTVYGLSPRDLMYLFIITNVLGVIKTPFISMLVATQFYGHSLNNGY